MRLLPAELRGNVFTVRIHTDDSKWVVDPANPEVVDVLEDGFGRVAIVPDPDYVQERVHTLNTDEDAQPLDQQMQSAVDEFARVVQLLEQRPTSNEDLIAKLSLPKL